MSDAAARSESTPEQAVAKPCSRFRRIARAVILPLVIWYGVILIVLGVFQRSLMYFPSRAERIDPAAAGLGEGVVHHISYPTEDGLTLHAWHVLPAGRSCTGPDDCDRELARGRLLVVHFHGNGGDRRGRVDDALIFGDHGTDVFLTDYRGYAENPGSPSETGLAADARAVWKYATEDRGVEPQRIVLYGESLGGAVAVGLAAELCEAGTPPAGLIMLSTFSSMTDVAAWHYPWLPVRLLLLDRYPSMDRIGSVTCPIFFIHAGEDRIVPIELGRRLFAAAPERTADGVEKRFVELAGCDHNDVFFRARAAFEQAIGEFLAQIRTVRR